MKGRYDWAPVAGALIIAMIVLTLWLYSQWHDAPEQHPTPTPTAAPVVTQTMTPAPTATPVQDPRRYP